METQLSPPPHALWAIASLQHQEKLQFEEVAPKAQPEPAVSHGTAQPGSSQPKAWAQAHSGSAEEQPSKCAFGAQLREWWL